MIADQLNQGFAKRSLAKGAFQVTGTAESHTDSGNRRIRLIQGGAIKVGEFPTVNPIFGGDKRLNILSLHYLSRYNVVLDFPNSQMFLCPNKDFKQKIDERNLSGMHFVRTQDGTRVESVDAGSAADISGVKTNDLVRKVNASESAKLRLYEIEHIFCQAKSTVHITLERDGKQIEAAIKLD